MVETDGDLLPPANPFLPKPADPRTKTGPFPLLDTDVTALSQESIANSVLSAPKLYDMGGNSVSRISPGFVVKHGSDVNRWEARTMRFVMENSKVALPRIHDFWEDPAPEESAESTRTCYILMEHIEGDLLYDVYSTLDPEARYSISKQLIQAVSELQQLTANSPGPVGGGLSMGDLFTWYDAGPFGSREEIADWFAERLQVCHDFGHATQVVSLNCDFDRLVMCHMDLHARNIIADRLGKIWLIDWGQAGFYPPHFELAQLKSEAGLEELRKWMMSDERIRDGLARLDAIRFALTTGALCKPK